MSTKKTIQTIGRRKCALARATLLKGTGKILINKKEVVGYNISGQLRKYLPEFAEYYFREQNKFKIKHRFIYTKGIVKPSSKFYEVRYLPKEYTATTITLCYNNTTLNLIWEPEMIAIMIKSKLVFFDSIMLS